MLIPEEGAKRENVVATKYTLQIPDRQTKQDTLLAGKVIFYSPLSDCATAVLLWQRPSCHLECICQSIPPFIHSMEIK